MFVRFSDRLSHGLANLAGSGEGEVFLFLSVRALNTALLLYVVEQFFRRCISGLDSYSQGLANIFLLCSMWNRVTSTHDYGAQEQRFLILPRSAVAASAHN